MFIVSVAVGKGIDIAKRNEEKVFTKKIAPNLNKKDPVILIPSKRAFRGYVFWSSKKSLNMCRFDRYDGT
jgi:hypothetical protein